MSKEARQRHFSTSTRYFPRKSLLKGKINRKLNNKVNDLKVTICTKMKMNFIDKLTIN